MEAPSSSRVIIVVAPRVFGDALCVALRDHDLAVTVLGTQTDLAAAERYDVAVVTAEPLPDHIVADVVIRIPEASDPEGIGLVRAGEGSEPVVVRSLTDMVELVWRFVSG